MSRCQHNQKIIKFCITPSCNHLVCGGCQYCFKRYHCHIGQAKFMKEAQVNDMVKYLTSFQDKKPKVRPLKQAIYNYFNVVKGQISTYLDCMSTELLNKISYPYMNKQGQAHVLKKLKNKQYNKLSTEQMLKIVQFNQNNDSKKLQNNEILEYMIQTKQVFQKITSINNLYKNFQQQSESSYTGQKIMSVDIFYKKILDISAYLQNETTKKLTINSSSDEKIQFQKKANDNKIYETNTIGEKKSKQLELELKNHKKQSALQLKQMTQLQFKGKTHQPIQKQISTQLIQTIRPRIVSIDSRCTSLIGKSRLKTYQQKEKQISQQKKKLQNMIINSDKKKQPQNVQSSGSSNQCKGQDKQGYQLNDNLYQDTTKSNDNLYQDRTKPNDIQNIGAYILLPEAKDQRKLYDQQRSVQRKTLKIPVNVIQQNAEDQQCQSPILRLKKSEKSKPPGGLSGFKLGLFKVEPASSLQTHQEDKIGSSQSSGNQNSNSSVNDKENKKPVVLIEEQVKLQISEVEANSLFLLIQSLKLSGKKAIPLLQGSLKYAAHNFSTAQYLSFLYLQQNKPKQCLRVCNETLKLIAGQPSSLQISFHLYNNKAASLNMLGRFSQSIPILQKCIQGRKKDIFYKNLGDSYFHLGIIEKAIINYQNATILNDQNHQALYNLAVSLYIQKNFQQAKLKVQRAIMLDQKNQEYLELYKEIQKIVKVA